MGLNRCNRCLVFPSVRVRVALGAFRAFIDSKIGGPVLRVLHEFIFANRESIIERAKARVRARIGESSADAKVEHGVPVFLMQLVDALARDASANSLRLVRLDDSATVINDSAALHGFELLKNGFTIGQVVHGYGDVCQVVTELASDTHTGISVDDFRVFNRCLDDAIAGAVTAYASQGKSDLPH